MGYLGGSQHPIPAGVQTGWVPSPAVLHGGCSEVAGFDGLVVPSGLRLDGGVQAYLGSPSWWLGCWFRRLGQEWAGRAWGACAASARFVTPQAHHPVWHQLRAGMALAFSQQPWMAILGGEMGTARPSQRSERPVTSGPTRCPLCLPGQPCPRPLGLHGEPWVTEGKQSRADCPYRTGADKAWWEKLAVVTQQHLPPAPKAA